MKLQNFNTLTLFLFLTASLSMHGMEHNNNELHPLLRLPAEVQQQIVFPWYTSDRTIDVGKMNELKEVVKTFFVFSILSKNFNQYFKLPWSNLKVSEKNEMLEKIIDYMTILKYKTYRTVPLVLVYSGANADVKHKLWPTCLHSAVNEEDELAVAMLLENGADPYQVDDEWKPICFYASTVAIAQLFLKKIDNNNELLKRGNAIGDLLDSNYSSKIMEFWFEYGVNPRHIYSGSSNDCLWHCLVRSLYWYGNTMENIRAKSELLLKYIPDIINTIDTNGETPLDVAIRDNNNAACCIRGAHKELIALLKKHGGKTAKEFELKSTK